MASENAEWHPVGDLSEVFFCQIKRHPTLRKTIRGTGLIVPLGARFSLKEEGYGSPQSGRCNQWVAPVTKEFRDTPQYFLHRSKVDAKGVLGKMMARGND